MGTKYAVNAIPMLAAAVLVPLAILAQASGEQKTLTGVVSDAMCGTTHMMKGKPRGGMFALLRQTTDQVRLVSGKNVYTLEGLRSRTRQIRKAKGLRERNIER